MLGGVVAEIGCGVRSVCGHCPKCNTTFLYLLPNNPRSADVVRARRLKSCAVRSACDHLRVCNNTLAPFATRRSGSGHCCQGLEAPFACEACVICEPILGCSNPSGPLTVHRSSNPDTPSYYPLLFASQKPSCVVTLAVARSGHRLVDVTDLPCWLCRHDGRSVLHRELLDAVLRDAPSTSSGPPPLLLGSSLNSAS